MHWAPHQNKKGNWRRPGKPFLIPFGLSKEESALVWHLHTLLICSPDIDKTPRNDTKLMYLLRLTVNWQHSDCGGTVWEKETRHHLSGEMWSPHRKGAWIYHPAITPANARHRKGISMHYQTTRPSLITLTDSVLNIYLISIQIRSPKSRGWWDTWLRSLDRLICTFSFPAWHSAIGSISLFFFYSELIYL